MRGRRKADPTGMAACGQIPIGLCAHALFAVFVARSWRFPRFHRLNSCKSINACTLGHWLQASREDAIGNQHPSMVAKETVTRPPASPHADGSCSSVSAIELLSSPHGPPSGSQAPNSMRQAHVGAVEHSGGAETQVYASQPSARTWSDSHRTTGSVPPQPRDKMMPIVIASTLVMFTLRCAAVLLEEMQSTQYSG